ncbi:MAG: hypothetical protein K6G60_07330, partial [Lachnospiraceae bacterium]|nr:hypothetical protein [Lachnospiraceae bacterium]
MTIKEMYKCKKIVGEDSLLPLPNWYNHVIEKDIDELDLSDVLKMLRQRLFLKVAVKKTIDFLLVNPFIGELYEGELME